MSILKYMYDEYNYKLSAGAMFVTEETPHLPNTRNIFCSAGCCTVATGQSFLFIFDNFSDGFCLNWSVRV